MVRSKSFFFKPGSGSLWKRSLKVICQLNQFFNFVADASKRGIVSYNPNPEGED